MAFEAPVPVALAVPFVAGDTILQTSPPLTVSASVAFKVRLNAMGLLSSSIVSSSGPLPSLMTGASFCGVTSIYTITGAEYCVPS